MNHAFAEYRWQWIAMFLHGIVFTLLACIALYHRNSAYHDARNRSRAATNDNVVRVPHDARFYEAALAESARISRETLLIFLAATTATGFGYGPSVLTVTLSWLGFGFSIFAAIVCLFMRHPIVTAVPAILGHCCFLVVFALAFRDADGARGPARFF